MSLSVGRRIWALLSSGAGSGVGPALAANAFASLAIGYLTFELNAAPILTLVLVPVSFLFLTGCLIHHRMVWVATVLGAVVGGGVVAFALAAVSENLHPLAPWVAGPVGFALGAAAAVFAYRDVARVARTGRASP
jgi:hypothetical protein